MSEDNSYTPVSCEQHSEFELLIIHNSILDMTWQDTNGNMHTETVKPKDIKIQSGEEFLIVFNEQGEQHRIRLDRIQSYKKTNL